MSEDYARSLQEPNGSDWDRRLAEHMAAVESAAACQGVYMLNEATGEVTHLGDRPDEHCGAAIYSASGGPPDRCSLPWQHQGECEP